MGRRQRTRTERNLIVREWKQSGRSQRAFCSGTGISPSSLARWARETNEEFVELVVDDVTSDAETVDGPQFFVVLPSEVTIGVPLGFDGPELLRLIRVLSC